MSEPHRTADVAIASRPAPPSLKERNAVQRSVDRLLDELAPEKALRRSESPAPVVAAHRTPSGCVLQAPEVALSVSWFADASEELTLGELQVVLWHGVVTRRGVAPPAKGAIVAHELVLHPENAAVDGCFWRALDGRRFDSESLAAYCVELLDELRA